MPSKIHPQVASHVVNKVLALSGQSGDDFYVRAVEIDSKIKRYAMKFFQLVGDCECMPTRIRLWALQGKNGVTFELVERDKVKEKLVGACRYLPYVGLAAGVVAGLIYRTVAPAGASGMLSQAAEAVNSIKQWEIKNKLAYLTPFIIPAAIHTLYNLRAGEENTFLQRAVKLIRYGLQRKLGNDPDRHNIAVLGLEVNRWVVSFLKVMSATFKTRVPYLLSVATLGLSNPLWTSVAGYLVPGFDLSGHCFLKTACAALLSSELKAMSKKASTSASWALAGYAALYALSDAVLMFNTVARHHTPTESVAGIACAAFGIWQLDGLTRHARKTLH